MCVQGCDLPVDETTDEEIHHLFDLTLGTATRDIYGPTGMNQEDAMIMTADMFSQPAPRQSPSRIEQLLKTIRPKPTQARPSKFIENFKKMNPSHRKKR
jgi:hypothetical protein